MHPKIVPVHDFLFSTEFAASKGKKKDFDSIPLFGDEKISEFTKF